MGKYLSHDLSINMGTANTVVYDRRQGVVAHEPSVVAMQERLNGSPVTLHVGRSAKAMIGRTSPQVSISRPVREGVVADCNLAQMMIEHCLQKGGPRKRFHSLRFVLGVPVQCSIIEKRAMLEAARGAGASDVSLMSEPLAVALGESLDIREPYGRMIVDMGAGATDVSVISVGGLVYNKTLRQGGDAMDEAIIAALRRTYQLDIGLQTAEHLKIELGTMQGRRRAPIPADRGHGCGDSYTALARSHLARHPRRHCRHYRYNHRRHARGDGTHPARPLI